MVEFSIYDGAFEKEKSGAEVGAGGTTRYLRETGGSDGCSANTKPNISCLVLHIFQADLMLGVAYNTIFGWFIPHPPISPPFFLFFLRPFLSNAPQPIVIGQGIKHFYAVDITS